MDETIITDMPMHEFVATCLGWKADLESEGAWEQVQSDIDGNVLRCPVHQYSVVRGQCKTTVGGTAKCRVCGHYMCPGCSSHTVDILSRVTGYLQVVSGWNSAKTQEFEDRTRYTLQ